MTRFIQECGQPPEVLDGRDITRRGQSGLKKKRAKIVPVRPKIRDLFSKFRQAQRVKRAQITGKIFRGDIKVVQWRGHGAPRASPALARAFLRNLYRQVSSRIRPDWSCQRNKLTRHFLVKSALPVSLLLRLFHAAACGAASHKVLTGIATETCYKVQVICRAAHIRALCCMR